MIVVRPARGPREYAGACDLAEALYQRYGYCHHLEDRQREIPTVVALDGAQIVGAVQFQRADGGQLPTEYHFGFAADRVLCARRREIYEISRLISTRGTDLLVVTSLLAAVLGYAFANGFTVGVGIVKPRMAKVLNRRLDIPTPPLAAHPVVRDRAGVFAPYLLRPPHPLLVYLPRADAARYLPQLAAKIAGRADIDVRGLDRP
jgi:hypothetical protein